MIASYFEWAQNLQEFLWEESRVNGEFKKTILTTYHAVWTRSVKQQNTHRQASFDIGVPRVARAVELWGFVQRSCHPTAVSHWGLALCAPSGVILVLPRKERNRVATGTIAVRRQRDPSPSVEMGDQVCPASVKSPQPPLRKRAFWRTRNTTLPDS